MEQLTKTELNGKITLITGPMFAGKSNKIIELAELFESVEAFKPSIHIRDGNTIYSRTGKEIPCHLIDDIEKIKESKAEAIIVDEIQFFNVELLKDVLEYFKREKRTLIIAGLRKKDRIEYWQNYKLLKEKSDILIKLTARCEICGKPAKYTYTNKQNSKRGQERKKNFGTFREPRCGECYNLSI